MEKLSLDLPRLYGDHHVVEVRRILLAIPGVEEVYASSAFRLVEISYDPAKVSGQDLQARLEASGYLDDLNVEVEPGAASGIRSAKNGGHFRQTAQYEQLNRTVGFKQQVKSAGRALWPCPGLGSVNTNGEEN